MRRVTGPDRAFSSLAVPETPQCEGHVEGNKAQQYVLPRTMSVRPLFMQCGADVHSAVSMHHPVALPNAMTSQNSHAGYLHFPLDSLYYGSAQTTDIMCVNQVALPSSIMDSMSVTSVACNGTAVVGPTVANNDRSPQLGVVATQPSAAFGQNIATFKPREDLVFDCLFEHYSCGNPAIELIDGNVYFYSIEKTKELLKLFGESESNFIPITHLLEDDKATTDLSSIVFVVPDVPLALGSAEFVQSLYECTDAARGLDLVKVLRGVSDTSYPILLFVKPQSAWSFFLHISTQASMIGASAHLVKGLTAKVEATQQNLEEGFPLTGSSRARGTARSSPLACASFSASLSSYCAVKPSLELGQLPLEDDNALLPDRRTECGTAYIDFRDLPTVREALGATTPHSPIRSTAGSDSSFLRLAEEMAALDWASRSSGGWSRCNSGQSQTRSRLDLRDRGARPLDSSGLDHSGNSSRVTDPACLPYSMSDSDLFFNDMLDRRWSLLGDADGSDISDERIDRKTLTVDSGYGPTDIRLTELEYSELTESKQAAECAVSQAKFPSHDKLDASTLLSPSFLLRRCDFPVNCAVCLERVTWQSGAFGRREISQAIDAGGGSGSPLGQSGCDEKPLGVAINIVCGHSFHSECLLRWWDNSCPVCRHQQHLGKTPNCKRCGGHDALFCLSCGFVGCGGDDWERTKIWEDQNDKELEDCLSTEEKDKVHSPSYQHFLMSNHIYALELVSYRIWDHWEQCYVGSFSQLAPHGLTLSTKSAQQQQQLETSRSQEDITARLVPAEREGSIMPDQKANLESVPAAFHIILQRLRIDQDRVFAAEEASLVEFFEEKKKEAAQTAKIARKELEAAKQQRASLEKQLDDIDAEHASVLEAQRRLIARNRALEGLRKRLAEQADATTLREKATRSQYEQNIKEKSAIVAELTSQIADIAFHLRAQERVAEIPGLQEGSLVGTTLRPRRRFRRH